MPQITPFLWFDDQAEDAAKFYVSVFKNSKITNISRYTEAGPGPSWQRHGRGPASSWTRKSHSPP